MPARMPMRTVHCTRLLANTAGEHTPPYASVPWVQPRGPRARGIDGREELLPKVLSRPFSPNPLLPLTP
jgi:hypothetical protein